MAGDVSRLATLSVLILCFGYSKQKDAPRVETNAGVILGTQRTSETGKEIFSFTGIPYIQPPVGELRFKAPVPAKPFKEEFNATKDDAFCPQNLFGTVLGDEDCVILNVHTPWDPSSPRPTKPLAVMVFIHGGGFLLGSSVAAVSGMPDYLVEQDVVLVTINYRLGVIGFLSTEDEEASGNYGLLDQVEALKWVKKNIAAFGGNPDQVTIFGESAGGGSVHYLMLSPLAKGLFHRVIAQSGTALSPWARTTISKKNTKILAEKFNCSTSTSTEILTCLRKKDALELVMTDVVEKEQRAAPMAPLVWIPRIDHEASYPFFPKHSVDIITSGEFNRVPLLLGHTKDEGGGVLGYSKEGYEEEVRRLTKEWDNTCKVSIAAREYKISEDEGTVMCNEIKGHYIDADKTFEDNKLQYVKMTSDIYIVTGISKVMELTAEEVPVYSYSFNYDNGHISLMGLFNSTLKYVKGIVAHGDDLLYLFKYPQTKWTTQSPAYQMVEMMTKIWTDFAKTGVPSIPEKGAWPKATSKKSKYVVIDLEPTIQEDYRPDDMEFMKGIYSRNLYNTSIGKDQDSSASSSIHQSLFLPILFIVLRMLCFV